MSDPALVDLVQHPICVFLRSCSKDNDFKEFAHFFQELKGEGSNVEVLVNQSWRFSFLLICEMDQCLVKIKH